MARHVTTRRAFTAGAPLLPLAGARRGVGPEDLCGPLRVAFVDAHEDARVAVGGPFPDVVVSIVDREPGPGEWRVVTPGVADVRLRVVDRFPDVRVGVTGPRRCPTG